jgi:two-component system cell cycle response regulator CpdR
MGSPTQPDIGNAMSGDAQDVVLIVEDEAVIRQLLRDYLQGEGYHVLEAKNGVEAFDILARKPHLDLMIIDYRLSNSISGVDIAEPAVKLRPELKVIFISGYPKEIRDNAHPIAQRAPVLAKPFALADLQVAILKELV